jgi:Flp pilus assembly pilin Flp
LSFGVPANFKFLSVERKGVTDMELIKKLYREEEAQGMTEYALILAAVIGVIYVATSFSGFGSKLSTAFSSIGSKLASIIG